MEKEERGEMLQPGNLDKGLETFGIVFGGNGNFVGPGFPADPAEDQEGMAENPLLSQVLRFLHQSLDIEIQHFLAVLPDPFQTAVIGTHVPEMLIHVGLDDRRQLGDDFKIFFQRNPGMDLEIPGLLYPTGFLSPSP